MITRINIEISDRRKRNLINMKHFQVENAPYPNMDGMVSTKIHQFFFSLLYKSNEFSINSNGCDRIVYRWFHRAHEIIIIMLMNLQQCLNQPANTIEWKTVEEDLLTTAANLLWTHKNTDPHTHTLTIIPANEANFKRWEIWIDYSWIY